MNNGYIHEFPVRYEVEMYDTGSMRATMMAQQGKRIWHDQSGLHVSVYVNARSHKEALKIATKMRPKYKPFPGREPRLIVGGAEAIFEYGGKGKMYRW